MYMYSFMFEQTVWHVIVNVRTNCMYSFLPGKTLGLWTKNIHSFMLEYGLYARRSCSCLNKLYPFLLARFSFLEQNSCNLFMFEQIVVMMFEETACIRTRYPGFPLNIICISMCSKRLYENVCVQKDYMNMFVFKKTIWICMCSQRL